MFIMNLAEITAACRMGETVDQEQLILAVCAYDVLYAQLMNSESKTLTEIKTEYMKAGAMPPADYIGWANHPENPEFQEWYRAFNKTMQVQGLDPVCSSCAEGLPEHDCPKSKRECGHHCNCSWSQDECCWCGKKFECEDEMAEKPVKVI